MCNYICVARIEDDGVKISKYFEDYRAKEAEDYYISLGEYHADIEMTPDEREVAIVDKIIHYDKGAVAIFTPEYSKHKSKELVW